MSKLVRIMTASVLAAALMLGSTASVAFAQASAEKPPAVATQNANATRNVSTDTRFADLRRRGFDALYNLDYAEARRHFAELQRLFPDHPAGWQFLAACLTVETLNRSRRLQISLYSDENFYAEENEKPDPQIVREFRQLTKRAEELATARTRRDPQDAEALYFLGAVKALRAAFGVSVERRFSAALGDGRAAVDKHRQVVKLDPTFTDAKLTIGIYDYVVGDLPLALRVGASIVGFRGSKKRGLRTLEEVAAQAQWAGDDARVLLVGLYRNEDRPADAARLARQLVASYPRNHLFRLELADALVAQAATERAGGANIDSARRAETEAFAIFDEILAPPARPRRGETTGVPRDLVYYKYGEALITSGQPERAAAEFLRAAAAPSAEANLATWARLRAAQALDLAGKRAEALTEYRAVLARPNVYNAHSQATRGVREPYEAKRTRRTSQGDGEKETSENERES